MGLDLSSPIPVTRYLTRPKAGIVLYSFLGIHPKGFLRQAHTLVNERTQDSLFLDTSFAWHMMRCRRRARWGLRFVRMLRALALA